MTSLHQIRSLLAAALILIFAMDISAQDNITWLDDYTSEMAIGNDTYRYSFTTVEGNDCKVEFKELVTDKKGSTESRSWIFYLSDIDPSALKFNPRGKAIEVTLETMNGQEFISYYEEGTFDEYTDEIKLAMNEVVMTRTMLEAIREHIPSCMETEVSWDDREAAFDWLTGNIGQAVDDDVQWEQEFTRAEKPYLARLSSRSGDAKGAEGSFEYLFDLSDINPASVSLEVSGRSLGVEVPVREGEDLIEVNMAEGKEYTDELVIYADDIELARQMVHAIAYLAENTMAERPDWNSYGEALGFVEENLGEVKIGEETFAHNISFNGPSEVVELTITETGSDGESEELTYALYLADMTDKLVLDVSRDEVTVEMETLDDRDFIRKISGGSITGYASSLEFHTAGVDEARDIIRAFETAIRNSEEEIAEFASVDEVNDWMEENLVKLFRSGENYEQKLLVDKENGMLIMFERRVTEDDGEATETRYLVYPDDISKEELKIGVSMGRLNVALETDKDDFIRYFKNGALQNYVDDIDVYFSDPLVAKNFMAAIRFLKEQVAAAPDAELSRDDAVTFLNWNIPQVEVPGMIHKQDMEITTGDECSLKFTRTEEEDDGDSDEYAYEFMAQDIDSEKSTLEVNRNLIEIHLVTTGNRKLIKPYENGEVEDFDDELTIYSHDVLLARKILAAFGVLAAECR